MRDWQVCDQGTITVGHQSLDGVFEHVPVMEDDRNEETLIKMITPQRAAGYWKPMLRKNIGNVVALVVVHDLSNLAERFEVDFPRHQLVKAVDDS